MRTRTLVAVTITLGLARGALALDAYQDRRGVFTALDAGAGFVSSGGESQVGARLGARVGGGMSQTLTADLGIDYTAVPDLDAWSLGFDLAANWFPLEHAFLRGGAGLSLLHPDDRTSKTGLGAIAGVGVEGFFGADLAGGVALTYEPELYGEAQGPGDIGGAVHQVFLTVTVAWY